LCYDYAMDWPLLAPLNDAERTALLGATRRRTFAKGEVLFHEGDPADALHLVEAGHLAVRVTTPDGERATINVLSPGDIVGELSLLEDQASGHRSATVTALEATQTRALTGTAFQALCREHPGVRVVLGAALAERIRELSARLLEAMYVGLDRRVYRRLLDLATVYGTGNGDAVIVPLTQEQLADLVGGTRPSVNQVLQRLLAQDVIDLGRGRVVVRDVAALRRKAGQA
jgi:CRP/FNR family cyclic AMP-dependent transcriptional regulator